MFRVLFLILFVMSSLAFAQTPENNQQEKKAHTFAYSYIVAEFGRATNTEVKEQFLEFDEILNKQFDSKGFIINYGTGKEMARREKQLRDSIRFRKYDASRITFVRGGNIAKLKSVFWVVPAGAFPPTP
ncbi:MAG: hypothetical protein M3033_05115 [Acidobacteriota bacterium]|nr:hypothetical protein [Acidobacteriota bacterium]